MTRDEVLKMFGRTDTIGDDGFRIAVWIDKSWSDITDAMADRIVELTGRLAAVEAERNWLRDASRSVIDDATKQYGSDKYAVDCKHIWALNDALECADYDDDAAAEKEVQS